MFFVFMPVCDLHLGRPPEDVLWRVNREKRAERADPLADFPFGAADAPVKFKVAEFTDHAIGFFERALLAGKGDVARGALIFDLLTRKESRAYDKALGSYLPEYVMVQIRCRLADLALQRLKRWRRRKRLKKAQGEVVKRLCAVFKTQIVE